MKRFLSSTAALPSPRLRVKAIRQILSACEPPESCPTIAAIRPRGVVSATDLAMQQVPPDIQACTIPSREPHHSLPVAPLAPGQRCYGEATVRVWGGSGEAIGGGRYVTHYPENSEEPEPAPQVPQPQRLKVTSWERHRVKFRVSRRRCNILPLLAGHTSSGRLLCWGDFSQ